MAEIFRLPAVSPTMETGTIVAWRVPEGAALTAGDVLVEVATDKATVEAQVFEDGVLLARLVPEDAEVPVGAPIAVLGRSGEDVAALVAEAKAELARGSSAVPEASSQAPASAPPPPPSEPPDTPTLPTPPTPAPSSAGAARAWSGRTLSRVFLDPAAEAQAPAPDAGWVRASPLARKLAHERGIDLRTVHGSGRGGRIVRADLDAVQAGPAPAAARPDTVVKLTPMRKVIARRLLASHQEIPVYFLTATYDVSAWPTLREALKAVRPELSISYNDLLIAAVARALALSPQVNASWSDQGIVRHGRVDVGVAVAVDDGLVTPVIRGADALGLADLAARGRALAQRARDGQLLPEDYQGATFTVSNLGMFDIEQFTAVINPPEAAILAAGAVQQVPVVVGGSLAVGWRMKVTMSCDHRVIDGAVGAEFLRVLRRFVEAPALLAL